MYQARRVAEIAVERVDSATVAARRSAPRRAVVAPRSMFLTRVAPATLAAALVATAGAVTLGARSSAAPAAEPVVEAAAARVDQLSRSEARRLVEANTAPVAAAWSAQLGAVVGTWHTQADVTVRTLPAPDASELSSLKGGVKVQVTERVVDGFREVVIDQRIGWVPANTVAEGPPAPGAGLGGAPLSPGKTSTTRVLGLTPQAMGVYNAVMGRWGGAINSVGGWRARSLSDHQYGRAIDFMLTPGKESALGWTVAQYLAANASELGVDHIIFEQKIWTPYKPYWRPMADRGSITANHYDHVHVSVKL